MKKLLPFLILIIPVCLHAQTDKTIRTANLTFSAGNGFSVAPSYFHNWRLGNKRKIEVGLGLRLTSYFAADKDYLTAPAKLTSGKTGPGVLFTENIKENIDSLFIPKSNTNALNLALELGYNITPKLYAGFNIDLIGFSFGKKVDDATYKYNKDHIPQDVSSNQSNIKAKPTGFNALLISDNDLGNLNSALTVRYKLTDKIGIHGGVSFYFSEYTTDKEIQQTPSANDRFRYKSLAPSLGVSWFLN
ncbi:hypothetical protein [Niabella ginsengisoli]|uniref:Outer membrane protein beta-barrel domain-containing protein n=1 Tax=Niabella ginsengisoli TaxID=522298 RepID=A0ABS9SJZ8_9BACT|nr:hypothetical protein [Niabella ginsengisoli]MCH5598707.1 hypothetical protein [Niabella ginsengisoli]